MKVYTLKNCDTCKKALNWLANSQIEFENHDIRADGMNRTIITPIVEALGWETALNRRSTTWRGLNEADKDGIDNTKAIGLIVENPTLMRRPVFAINGSFIAGFDAKAQAALEVLL